MLKKRADFQKIIHFIKYHNAFTIGLALLLLSASVFAASPAAREAVVGKAVTVKRGIDNTILLAANLNNFNLGIKITNVSEDQANYYISYTYQTLGVKDNVWQKVEKSAVLKVSKLSLGKRDLGLYATEQLGQVADAELSYLKKVQSKERKKGKTLVKETTKYTGLIGLVLSPKTRKLPGYIPVVKPSKIVVKPNITARINQIEKPAIIAKRENSTAIAPSPIVSFTDTPYSAKAKEQTTFKAVASNFATDTLVFNWSFGDSSSTATNLPTVTHTYNTAGVYSVVLSVSSRTQQVSASTQIEITTSTPTTIENPATTTPVSTTTTTIENPANSGTTAVSGTATSRTASTTETTSTEATTTSAVSGTTTPCETQTFYLDADADGYGNPLSATSTCEQPTGYVSGSANSGTDCDDSNSNINPSAIEICGDGIDNNCDGTIDENCLSSEATTTEATTTTP